MPAERNRQIATTTDRRELGQLETFNEGIGAGLWGCPASIAATCFST
jgi:hypothetical protein